MSQPQKKTFGRTATLLLSFIVLCVSGGIVSTGFMIPAVWAAKNVTESMTPSLKEDALSLDLSNLPQQSRIFASDGKTVLATFYDQNRIVVPLKDIAKVMQQAVVAREDHRFFEHSGVDVQGVARAFVQTYIKHGDTQGGSTLTQQYVKNALMNIAARENDPLAVYHAREETIARKAREMLIAVQIEKKYTKPEILQGYLNIAQFGKNVYGVETAAQHYFSKSAKDLTLPEAATIAAITKNPARYDPTVNPEESQRQRNITLNLMAQWGFVSQQAADQAKKIPLKDTLHVKDVTVGCQTAGKAAWFCDYVVNQIRTNPVFGKTEQDRKILLKEGGLNIYTTLDIKASDLAYAAVRQAVNQGDSSGLAAAMAVVQPGTGHILALAQNREYDPTAADDGVRTALNYAVDEQEGGSSGFGPGSSFKPINMVAWLQAGYSINEPLRTSTYYPVKSFPCANQSSSSIWHVTNYGGGTVNPETPLHALMMSHNTTQASIAQRIGLCKIADAAHDLGYHFARSKNNDPRHRFTPPSVIGVDSVSPLTMANVYATIAARGKRCNPVAITKITNAAGKNLRVPQADCVQAINPKIAETVAYAMNKNVTGGIAAAAQLPGGRKTYAKTGTNEAYSLAFGGFIPQVVAFIMTANPISPFAHPIENMRINGVYSSFWDGSFLIPAWKHFMTSYIQEDNIPVDNALGNPDPSMIRGVGTTSLLQSFGDFGTQLHNQQNHNNQFDTTTTPNTTQNNTQTPLTTTTTTTTDDSDDE